MEEIESIKLTLLQGRQNSLVIMKSLDNQFQILKERLLKDRVDEIDKKVKDLNNETLQEWIQGMDELKNELQVTLEMADNYHALCLKNCEKELDFEIQAAQNDFESSKDLLIKNALREYHVKTIAVEEKRKTLNSSKNSINNPKKPFIEFRYPKKRIKPTTVTDILFMNIFHFYLKQ
ncbi:unnamed protein product [Gordionus sp. m RMFG-2023]